jgi:hypothetical protein
MPHQDKKRFQIAPLTLAFTFLKKPIKPKTSAGHQLSLYHNMSPTPPFSLSAVVLLVADADPLCTA